MESKSDHSALLPKAIDVSRLDSQGKESAIRSVCEQINSLERYRCEIVDPKDREDLRCDLHFYYESQVYKGFIGIKVKKNEDNFNDYVLKNFFKAEKNGKKLLKHFASQKIIVLNAESGDETLSDFDIQLKNIDMFLNRENSKPNYLTPPSFQKII